MVLGLILQNFKFPSNIYRLITDYKTRYLLRSEINSISNEIN